MFLVKVKRVIKTGFINFWRNGWVSVATLLVMVIALFVIGSLFFGKALLLSSLQTVEDKVDVTVYFKTDAQEEDVLLVKDSLSKLNEVKSVEYVSKDQAINIFKERHADNSLIMQSLDELGDNPLGASLNVKAKNTSQYESISRFLEAGLFSSVDKINYHQNKVVIDRLANILQTSKTVGAGISTVLAFLALLVTFNTIRLAIYTNREEIKIMKLVGASNRYIKGPYVIEGAVYGLLSAFITMILFFPLVAWIGPMYEQFFSGLNVYNYYLSHFFQLLFVLVSVGVGLGVFSSWIATRRYLKI